MSTSKRPVIGVNSTYHEETHRWYKVPVNYINAIYRSGGLPLIFPCNPEESELRAYLERVDGMVFTGGDDYPAELYGDEADLSEELMEKQRVRTDIMLMKMVLDTTDMPLLAICAGHQLLAIASGGRLIPHIKNAGFHGHKRETEHSAEIKSGKWLKSIFNTDTIIVNSNHHQAVSFERFPGDFEITARSEDNVIEAMEHRSARFVLGVQWHPERIANKEHTKALFGFFIEKTRERKPTE